MFENYISLNLNYRVTWSLQDIQLPQILYKNENMYYNFSDASSPSIAPV